jgi:protein gp37
MTANSKIEWTDHTFNPWVGCTKVSPACDHCYAESWAKRSGAPNLWNGDRRRTTAANWNQPIKWNAAAAKAGTRARVFCASLADVFDNAVPPAWRADLFRLIRATPHLDWLLLTKRIGNAELMIEDALIEGHLLTSRKPYWPWPNVWLGATIATQAEAARDIPKLRSLRARVRFLSCEPLLEAIRPDLSGIHWIIVGGESGSQARAMDWTWAESLRNQALVHGTAFFFKQGSATPNWPAYKDFASFPPSLQVREWPALRPETSDSTRPTH